MAGPDIEEVAVEPPPIPPAAEPEARTGDPPKDAPAPEIEPMEGELDTMPEGGCVFENIMYAADGSVWGCMGGGNWCASMPARPGLCADLEAEKSAPDGGCVREGIVYDADGKVYGCVGGGNWCAKMEPSPGLCERPRFE